MKQGLVLPPAAALLLWPALLNGYPLVFADTGTYLSQAINHHLGWDRPPFYSLFMLPLHLTITTWPVIAVQALMACWVLSLIARLLVARWRAWMLLPVSGAAALLTALPWTVSELSPDFLSALLILSLVLLVAAPAWLSRAERVGLVLLSAFAVAVHLSNLPLGIVVLGVLLAGARNTRRPKGRLVCARGWWGGRARNQRDTSRPTNERRVKHSAGWYKSWRAPVGAVALGAVALVAVNVAAGRGVSISPYGNVFLLARVIADGPGRDALVRECPRAGWRLCAYAGTLPDSADGFLWDGPLQAAGGAKEVSAEAGAIIASAVAAEPVRTAESFAANGVDQFVSFGTGDGLHAWPGQVTPWIERDFPAAEVQRYRAARQTRDKKLVGVWLKRLHAAVAVGGLLVCVVLAIRRRTAGEARLALGAMLAGLIANAIICGGLSGPHDRYQSRIMWLPGVVAAFVLIGRDPA